MRIYNLQRAILIRIGGYELIIDKFWRSGER